MFAHIHGKNETWKNCKIFYVKVLSREKNIQSSQFNTAFDVCITATFIIKAKTNCRVYFITGP